MDALRRCLDPGSFVVVGGRGAEVALAESRRFGFEGEIWAVNPNREEMAGVRCFPSLADLPAVPDSAFVSVPAEPTIEVVAELSAMGCGGAVCYASGFLEVGSDDRHRRLIEAAGNMPIIGPNCYGMINAMSGAVLWPDWHGLRRCERGVAIFTGSGNVSVNMTMQDRSLPIALLVTIGNQVAVGIEQLLEAALADDRITAIGLHIEGLKNLPVFIEIARRAAGAGKPVIALKTGRSEHGARIALSHTATLAGSAALYDTLFDRLGIGQVHDLESFLEALKLLTTVGPLSGGRIASMSCSGGEASLIADLCHETELSFPEISDAQQTELRRHLNEYVDISNPLDYHTFIWGDRERLNRTFAAMLADGFDLTLLLLDTPSMGEGDFNSWREAADAFVDACAETGAPGAVVASLAENMPAELRDYLVEAGIAPLMGLPQALSAIKAAVHSSALQHPLPTVSHFGDASANRVAHTESAAKDMLRDYGLPVARGRLADSVDSALAAARDIGYPVVLKASVEGLAHKTEANAVVLNIGDDKTVATEAERLLSLGGEVLVEQMVPRGCAELLLGVSYDEQFGHYLVLGWGGTLVEVVKDRELILLPASDEQIMDALNRLQVATLLDGYRGQPAGDKHAVVSCVQSLARFVAEHSEQLLEVDINPLIVGADQVTVADALLVFRASGE